VFRNVGILNSDAGELPEESVQHSEHGESLKSRIKLFAGDVYILQSDRRSVGKVCMEQQQLQLLYLAAWCFDSVNYSARY
jgi:hypothetical protein